MSNIPISSETARHDPDDLTTAEWMPLVRRAWVVIVGLTILIFAMGLVVGFGQLRQVCTSALCHPLQLSPEETELHAELGLSLDFYAAYTTLVNGLFGITYAAVGILIFWRKQDDWMALFVAFFLAMTGAGAVPVIVALDTYHPSFTWVQRVVMLLGMHMLPLMLLAFPDFRSMSRWTRWLAVIWVVYSVVIFLVNPFDRAGIQSGPPSPITVIFFLLGGLIQIYRHRTTSNPRYRLQTRWVVFGFLGHIVSLLILLTILNLFPVLTRPGISNTIYERYAFAVVGLLPVLFIPMSFAIAILRHRLWDIDIIIRRTLVYGILTALVIALYIVIVGTLSTLFQTEGNLVWSLIATGVVAVCFQTLRESIQRGINRLLFGERDEPYAVLERLSRQLEPVLAVDEVLPTIVETIATALRLPYAAVELRHHNQSQIVANYVIPDSDIGRDDGHVFPLVYQSQTVGQLLLAPRGRGESFSPTDLKLLEIIARQVSIAAYNVHLTVDLQRSRERLVTTREEERRRLRRDLHDGLGPVLASMAFRLDAIQNVVERDTARARGLAVEVRNQVQTSLSEIRRIAYNLRPPALDELGLVDALREHFVSLGGAGELQITFDAPETLPTLSAAVEVAAYRISLEAVTNVQRHARASRCMVRLTLARDRLCLEIVDNGRGMSQGQRSGIGLAAMRERADELGGQCMIENRLEGGTRIVATLPITNMG